MCASVAVAPVHRRQFRRVNRRALLTAFPTSMALRNGRPSRRNAFDSGPARIPTAPSVSVFALTIAISANGTIACGGILRERGCAMSCYRSTSSSIKEQDSLPPAGGAVPSLLSHASSSAAIQNIVSSGGLLKVAIPTSSPTCHRHPGSNALPPFFAPPARRIGSLPERQ